MDRNSFKQTIEGPAYEAWVRKQEEPDLNLVYGNAKQFKPQNVFSRHKEWDKYRDEYVRQHGEDAWYEKQQEWQEYEERRKESWDELFSTD